MTAYQYLFDHIRLDPDKTVLVNGATRGVGHFRAQLAKTKNAHVIGVASGRHAALLRDKKGHIHGKIILQVIDGKRR